jgi:hypothetical protein
MAEFGNHTHIYNINAMRVDMKQMAAKIVVIT